MPLGNFDRGGLGFGLAFTLEDEFTNTSNDIEQAMDGLDKKTGRFSSSISNSFNQIKVGAALLTAGLMFLIPAGLGLQAAGELEQVRIGFDTMLKSAELGGKVLNDLKQFSDVTPFTSDQVIKGGRALVSYDQDVSKLIPRMQMLGNVAASGIVSLSELIDIYGKNLLQPYLERTDIMQMASRGIPIIKALADVMGVAQTKVLGLATEHKITADVMEAAFKKMTTGDGVFAGLMEKQSQSMNGLISTLKSYLHQVILSFGEPLIPLVKPVIRFFIDLAQKVRDFMRTDLGKGIALTITAIGGLLTIGGGLLLFVGTAKLAIGGLMATVGLSLPMLGALLINVLAVVAPIALLGYVVYKAVKSFNDLKTPATGFLGFLQRLGGYILTINQVWQSWDRLTGTFSLTEGLKKKLDSLGILDTALAIGTWVVRVKEFLYGIYEGMANLYARIQPILSNLYTAFTGTVNGMFDLFDITLGKNTSSLERWSIAGQGYADLVVLALTPLIWLMETITFFLDTMTEAVDGFQNKNWSQLILGNTISDFLGLGDEPSKVNRGNSPSYGRPKRNLLAGGLETGVGATAVKFQGRTMLQPPEVSTVQDNVGGSKPMVIHTFVQLEGDTIATAVNNVNEFNDSRQ